MIIKANLPKFLVDEGTYRLINKGKEINISFMMIFDNLEIKNDSENILKQIYLSKYKFVGEITGIYNLTRESIISLTTSNFSFYIRTTKDFSSKLVIGNKIEGNGVLIFDPCFWENIFEIKDIQNYNEFVTDLENIPILYYNFKISNIEIIKFNDLNIKGKLNSSELINVLIEKKAYLESIIEINKNDDTTDYIFTLDSKDLQNKIIPKTINY